MPEVSLRLYKLIEVSGTDKIAFLQGQLTQDVSCLSKSTKKLAAWCNPKGRVIVTMSLLLSEEAIVLVVPAGIAESILDKLAMYRLRSDVSFALSDAIHDSSSSSIQFDQKHLILHGIPIIDETNSESYTPHMLNLDKLSAISFDKGCYTGQEVVARTEHLGNSKRRMMRYQADSDGLRVGSKLSDGTRNVGTIVNISGRDLLAVTPVAIHKESLIAESITVTPLGVPYEI